MYFTTHRWVLDVLVVLVATMDHTNVRMINVSPYEVELRGRHLGRASINRTRNDMHW